VRNLAAEELDGERRHLGPILEGCPEIRPPPWPETKRGTQSGL
jgi:hypothetical protein